MNSCWLLAWGLLAMSPTFPEADHPACFHARIFARAPSCDAGALGNKCETCACRGVDWSPVAPKAARLTISMKLPKAVRVMAKTEGNRPQLASAVAASLGLAHAWHTPGARLAHATATAPRPPSKKKRRKGRGHRGHIRSSMHV